MLAKAICMLISGFTYYRSNMPPKAGMDVFKTEDKFGRDVNYRRFYVFVSTKISPLQAIFFPLAYIYLMARGTVSSDLELWMAIAVVLQWMGYALRQRAYTELDRYFTVSRELELTSGAPTEE
ncbi:hypothetical protein DFQ26_007642 [Actinomortierella ambigua]|nr:hypothetical protein DFQ26_007642 [Actinomortierella ambigua]